MALMDDRFYKSFAFAAVRGRLMRTGMTALFPAELIKKPLCEVTDEDAELAFDIARKNEIKLYHFKRSDRTMPRVSKVIGFLHSIYFENLLDVGSGRGVFLLPFMEEFPYIPVTSVEILPKRVDLLCDVSRGGITSLSVIPEDISKADSEIIPDKSYDVVTMLEVLEHIPDLRGAIRNAVRIARRFIVVTVPSKEDDNPEHIHLLTKEKLTALFSEFGVTKLSFDGVPCHLFMLAVIESNTQALHQ